MIRLVDEMFKYLEKYVDKTYLKVCTGGIVCVFYVFYVSVCGCNLTMHIIIVMSNKQSLLWVNGIALYRSTLHE